jgi:CheY-like chemotaxis protein
MTSPRLALVVEDELRFRRTIAAFLEDIGYQVVEAANGQEGLDLFARTSPHIVLTDLRMPVMDGMEFLARLKSTSPRTPVFVITGTGDRQALTAALEQGAAGCFVKPIGDMQELEVAMDQALQSAR